MHVVECSGLLCHLRRRRLSSAGNSISLLRRTHKIDPDADSAVCRFLHRASFCRLLLPRAHPLRHLLSFLPWYRHLACLCAPRISLHTSHVSVHHECSLSSLCTFHCSPYADSHWCTERYAFLVRSKSGFSVVECGRTALLAYCARIDHNVSVGTEPHLDADMYILSSSPCATSSR